MQKNYLLMGSVVIFILGSLILLGSKDAQNENGADNALTPVSSFSHSHGIAVNVSDPSKVYIATHEGLYLLSGDRDLYQIGKVRDDLMGFSPHPSEANAFFSSGHSPRSGNIGFQKTTDGGLTWTLISDGLGGRVDFHAMTVSQVNSSVIYGFFGGRLQRSVDEGISWEYAKGAIAPISLSTDPINENLVYASTQNGVLRSANKGDTWESISTQLEGGAVSVFVIDPMSTYSLAFSEKLSGLGKSTDGGESWQKVSETFAGEAVMYLAYSKSQTGTVYALTNANSVYKSIDSGTTWTKVR